MTGVTGTRVTGTAINIPIFLFAALAIISTFFSIYKHDSIYALLKLACYIGIYYLIVNEFDRKMVKRLLYVVIGMGSALSICGLLQHLNIIGHSWWEPKEFIAATFVNHNHFSGYLELVIPVAVISLMKRSAAGKPAILKILIVSALVIMVTVFILAQSRGAWIALSASFLVMMYVLAKKGRGNIKNSAKLILLSAAIVLLAYFGRDLISERVSGSISAESAGDSFATRLLIWRGAVNMIAHSPFTGTGIGTFVWGFPRYRPEGLDGLANFAHNDYLETACDMGIPALIIMLWIIAAVIRTGTGKDNLNSYRFGCALGVLSLSIHALSDFNFHIPANMLLFTVYSGIIMRGKD